MVTPASGALRWAFTFSRKKKIPHFKLLLFYKNGSKAQQKNLRMRQRTYMRIAQNIFEDAWRDYMKSTDEYNSWITKIVFQKHECLGIMVRMLIRTESSEEKLSSS